MKYLAFLASLLFLTSCGPKLSPLTQRIVSEQNWTSAEFERIQFYLSEDLVLTRELRNGNTQITNGQVRVINGKDVEQVVFPAKTPGVFVFSPKTERVAVSFESNNDNYLVFGPNPNAGNTYVLLAQDWDRRSGSVTYAGKTWRVSTSNAFASLMIPLKELREKKVNGRVVGGRKL
ncbi:hypothetical protein [Neolewinella antarctica]|uniref:Lipoprotein n=1 Tax=Neolewinella antarctica TaxID=442734 RepID=A0ABX0XDJ0_9BACT|nr:hypothetical protein [Neolewinella antarctica]NJC27316.1 hypothetical protein [Neolewinella antarctica]